jgi:hypothetical protein
LTIVLILSVLALIISAIVWGFGSNSSTPHLAGRGKIAVLAPCGAAVVCDVPVISTVCDAAGEALPPSSTSPQTELPGRL